MKLPTNSILTCNSHKNLSESSTRQIIRFSCIRNYTIKHSLRAPKMFRIITKIAKIHSRNISEQRNSPTLRILARWKSRSEGKVSRKSMSMTQISREKRRWKLCRNNWKWPQHMLNYLTFSPIVAISKVFSFNLDTFFLMNLTSNMASDI